MDMFQYTKYSFGNQELLSGLPEVVHKKLTAQRTVISIEANQSIFNEGDEPKGVYRILNGKVKKFTTTNFGTDHIFYVCKEQEYLGYHALLSEELYSDSAAALTNCELEFIPKNDFLYAVDKSHLLSQKLLKSLSHEFGVFLNATKLLAKHTVRERTAINLLILDFKFKTDSSTETVIRINRDDLSSMVGTAKESLVRMLKDFKQEKLIKTSGRSIYILDHHGLLKVSNSI